MCVTSGDKRCHTEVGAPAEQDCRSLVVRNMSRRPRTETSTLVLGPVVTALLQVYRITPQSTRGACAERPIHRYPALLPRSCTVSVPAQRSRFTLMRRRMLTRLSFTTIRCPTKVVSQLMYRVTVDTRQHCTDNAKGE